MNLFLLVCMIFATVRHRKNFGQFERKGDRSIFFINENKRVQVYIEDYPTGIKGNGLLFVDRALKNLKVDFYLSGHLIERRELVLENEAIWVLGPVDRALFPVAGVKALV